MVICFSLASFPQTLHRFTLLIKNLNYVNIENYSYFKAIVLFLKTKYRKCRIFSSLYHERFAPLDDSILTSKTTLMLPFF